MLKKHLYHLYEPFQKIEENSSSLFDKASNSLMTGKYVTGKENLEPIFFINVNAVSLRKREQIQANKILEVLFAITSRIYPRNYKVVPSKQIKHYIIEQRCVWESCMIISKLYEKRT